VVLHRKAEDAEVREGKMTDKSQAKRVLVVDDEPNVAMVLAGNLEKLGQEYIIDTASSGEETLAMLKKTAYALIITDYRMPGMSGLDLAQEVRRHYPETEVILITAYGDDKLRDITARLNLAGYVDKPFTMEHICEVVKRVVECTQNQTPCSGARRLEPTVHKHLQELRVNTGARCTLLLSSGGYIVDSAGETDGLDVVSLGALIAANFMAAAELAKMLGSGSIFKSSYHEGPDYNFYSHDVNGDLLLTVIFGVETKPGVIWFYTKRTAAELAPIFEAEVANTADALGDLTVSLGMQFDRSRAADADGNADDDEVLLSFQQALEEGLLNDDSWLE
jgi:CheY-like chemotaxis protein/predicted regulator of Ras-like GTPase activity (Roadblock/LC7/MglB family)